MKKVFAFALAIVMLFCAVPLSVSAAEEVTTITTVAQLVAIADNLSGNYKLGNDLDLSDYGAWTPIGGSTAFSGTFEGNGKTIKGLSVNTSSQYGGLFGNVSGTVKNLNVKGTVTVNMSSSSATSVYAGLVAGNVGLFGIVDSCSAEGNVTATLSCSSSSFIAPKGNAYAGGVIGSSSSFYEFSEISHKSGTVTATANMTNKGNAFAYAGGVAGKSGATIVDSYNKGDVSATATASSGETTAYSGGISGYGKNFATSYNTGDITASGTAVANAGAIAGYATGKATNCYYLSGCATKAFGGYSADTAPTATGLSSENSKKKASYAGFDFDNVWESSLLNTPKHYDKAEIITGTVAVTGTYQYGKTLTADMSAVTPSKAWNGTIKQVKYQWYRGVEEKDTELNQTVINYTAISKATSNTYKLTADDIGKYVKLVVRGRLTYGGMLESTGTKVEKFTPEIPTAPVVEELGDTYVIIKAVSGAEYGYAKNSFFDGSITWGTSNRIEGLSASTKYKLYVRIPESTTTNASANSEVTEVTTCEEGKVIHSYKDWVIDKEPTCTEEGIKHCECFVCGDVLTELIEATGHSYSEEWTVDIEPTYSVEGSKSRHCLNCNAKTDVTAIPVKDFNEVMYVVQEGGTCNGKLSYVVYLKAGVSIGGAIVYVEFDDNALEVYEGGAAGNIPGMHESGFCINSTNVYSMAFLNSSFDSYSEDTSFMKITFNINDGYSEADVKFTCKEFLSSNEDYNVPQSETPPLMLSETADITIVEHISSDWIEDSAATVYADGSKHKECTACGAILETETLPQLVCQTPELISVVQDGSGIVVTWGAVEGADSYRVYRKEGVDGSWKRIATVTGEKYIDQTVKNNTMYYYTVRAVNEAGNSEINKDGIGCEYHVHSFGDWEVTVPATCTTDGEKYRVCACGEEETEIIEASGHNYSTEWIIDVAPTCTEAGSKSHHCTVCDDKKDITVIVATGHNYILDNILDSHPHTKTYICSYCEDEKTEDLVESDCLECNYTFTAIDASSYKVVSYIGTATDVKIPATYNECAVTTISNGCFKGNTTITSIRIADGVTSIGSLAFMNCTSLERVLVPASVTNIGLNAFYGFTGTIYCFNGSTAHEYAIANNIDYVLLSLQETESTQIDYDNFVIYTSVENSSDIAEIFGVSDTAIAIPVASYVYGNLELYGTGTIITVFDGDDYIGDFTLIVEGDLNGDSVVDVLDAAAAQLYSAGHHEPTENEILAANGCISDEIDVNSYQNVVNVCLAS